MPFVAVIVPTIRAASVERVTTDLYATVSGDEARLVFVAESDDTAVHEAVRAAGQHLVLNQRTRNYAGAVNTALAETTEPYLFIGSDDLHFHRGWLPPLLDSAQEHGLVGTNDLHNPDVLAGLHATHYLATRWYAIAGCVDAPGCLLHEGYVHNYTDTEVVQTAQARGQFAHRADSVVEHLHPNYGLAAVDQAYEKSLTTSHLDAVRFAARRHLWTSR